MWIDKLCMNGRFCVLALRTYEANNNEQFLVLNKQCPLIFLLKPVLKDQHEAALRSTHRDVTKGYQAKK